MRKQPLVVTVLVLLLAVAWVGGAGAQTPAQEQQPALASYGRLPLHFETNQGQTAEQVKFLARGSGYTLFLTSNESVLVLQRPNDAGPGNRVVPAVTPSDSPEVVRMKLLGANPQPAVEGREELPGKSHYFIGNDPRRWRANVPQYARVEYREVYPGVNLMYYGNQGQLEYDFVVNPGADPTSIRLGIEGADEIRVDAEGNLHIHLKGGELMQRAPVVYQEVGGVRKVVNGRFLLFGANEVGFEVGRYDVKRPLVLDPVLVYSTYLGGTSDDLAYGVAVDASGSAYLTGYTESVDFPTANPLQASKNGTFDAFITKLDSAGSALVYSTYLGGSRSDFGHGIAVDASGNAYVTGSTSSTDFPTVDPLQPANGGSSDAFAAKLSPTGSALSYSTYLGGSGDEVGWGIAAEAGNAAVTGYTTSIDFPTFNPLQASNGGSWDAFIAKLTPAGSDFVYSTYLGGSAEEVGLGIAMESGNASVTGYTASDDFPTENPLQPTKAAVADAFVAKLNAAGSTLVYSTYLGGNSTDIGHSIAVDASGNAYIAGATGSTDFPTFKPFQASFRGGVDDAFVTKLNPDGSALVYSSYLGGSSHDAGHGIAVGASGNALITGRTASTDFPTNKPFQATNGGGTDAFVARLKPRAIGGTGLDYCSYLGGGNGDVGNGIAVDAMDNAYVTGWTQSGNFPTRNPMQPANAGASDAFVTKIGP